MTGFYLFLAFFLGPDIGAARLPGWELDGPVSLSERKQESIRQEAGHGGRQEYQPVVRLGLRTLALPYSVSLSPSGPAW